MPTTLVDILNGPITAFFVILGVILNIQTICILMRPVRQSFAAGARRGLSIKSGLSMTSSASVRCHVTSTRPLIYTYLLWLSFSDTALLISGFLMYCFPSFFLTSLGSYARFFPAFYLMSNASLTASVWLMCVLMFERYRALCRPLVTSVMSVAKVHKILASVVVLSVLFSLPRFFELLVYENEDGFYDVVQSDMGKNHFYLFYYRIIGGLVFYSVFPYVLLFAMSAKISLALRNSAKERRSMSRSTSSKTESKISDSELILLAVMAKFLVFRLMPTALDVAEHIVTSEVFVMSPIATLLVAVSNLLVVISSAINFFIYFLLSKSFRRLACFCCNKMPFKNGEAELARADCSDPTFKYINVDQFRSTLPLLNGVLSVNEDNRQKNEVSF